MDREGRKQLPYQQRAVSGIPGTTRSRSLRIATQSENNRMDPFADTQPLNRLSNSGIDYQDTSSMLSIPRSYLQNKVPILQAPQGLDMLDFLSSPNGQDFPSSSPTTPTVSSTRYNNAHRKEFSGSWLISSNPQSFYSEKGDDYRTSKGGAT